MHPLDTKILKYEFGSYSAFPLRIKASIISLHESKMDIVYIFLPF
jgi:hypothetical protein